MVLICPPIRKVRFSGEARSPGHGQARKGM